jgi:hypothetical protein
MVLMNSILMPCKYIKDKEHLISKINVFEGVTKQPDLVNLGIA